MYKWKNIHWDKDNNIKYLKLLRISSTTKSEQLIIRIKTRIITHKTYKYIYIRK